MVETGQINVLFLFVSYISCKDNHLCVNFKALHCLWLFV